MPTGIQYSPDQKQAWMQVILHPEEPCFPSHQYAQLAHTNPTSIQLCSKQVLVMGRKMCMLFTLLEGPKGA